MLIDLNLYLYYSYLNFAQYVLLKYVNINKINSSIIRVFVLLFTLKG